MCIYLFYIRGLHCIAFSALLLPRRPSAAWVLVAAVKNTIEQNPELYTRGSSLSSFGSCLNQPTRAYFLANLFEVSYVLLDLVLHVSMPCSSRKCTYNRSILLLPEPLQHGLRWPFFFEEQSLRWVSRPAGKPCRRRAMVCQSCRSRPPYLRPPRSTKVVWFRAFFDI